MAPVKKKRVWNFALELPQGKESSGARKRRRLVNNAVRNLVLQRRKSLERRIEREVRDNLRIRSMAAWQQLRHSNPFSVPERLARLASVDTLLLSKESAKTALLRISGKIERSSDICGQQLLSQLRDCQLPLHPHGPSEQPFVFHPTTPLQETPTEEAVEGHQRITSMLVSAFNRAASIEAGGQGISEEDSLTTAWWNEIYEEIRIHEELEERMKRLLLSAATLPTMETGGPSPFPLPSIDHEEEEEAASRARRRKLKKKQQQENQQLQQSQPQQVQSQPQQFPPTPQSDPRPHQAQHVTSSPSFYPTLYPSTSLPYSSQLLHPATPIPLSPLFTATRSNPQTPPVVPSREVTPATLTSLPLEDVLLSAPSTNGLPLSSPSLTPPIVLSSPSLPAISCPLPSIHHSIIDSSLPSTSNPTHSRAI